MFALVYIGIMADALVGFALLLVTDDPWAMCAFGWPGVVIWLGLEALHQRRQCRAGIDVAFDQFGDWLRRRGK